MVLRVDKQRTSLVDNYLLTWVEAFIIDRKAGGMAKGTISFYNEKLRHFTDYCESQAVKSVIEITPALIREYLLFLESRHNPGGIHAHYRALRTFLFWWEEETEPENWKNPIRKVRAPKLVIEPIEGVSLETVRQLVKACKRGAFTGDRDIAILFCLFDTGARASEFLDLNLEDVNQARGEILIRKGKGRKPRCVYTGRTARKALRKYLKHRSDDCPALWVTNPHYGIGRLTYSGLRMMSLAGRNKPV